jgi:hypothetical protein
MKTASNSSTNQVATSAERPSVFLVRSRSAGFLWRKLEAWLGSQRREPLSLFRSGFDVIRSQRAFPESVLIIFNMELPEDFVDLGVMLNWLRAMELDRTFEVLVLDHVANTSLQDVLIERGCRIVDSAGCTMVSLKATIEQTLALMERKKRAALLKAQTAVAQSTILETLTPHPAEKPAEKRSALLFKPIDDVREILNLLHKVFSSRRLIKLRLKGNVRTFKVQLTHAPSSLDQVFMKLKKPEEMVLLRDELERAERLGVQVVLGQFGLSTGTLFITADCPFATGTHGSIRLRLHPQIYSVQRRNTTRVPVPSNSKIVVQAQGEARSIINISAGGMAFRVKPEDIGLFEMGVILPLRLATYLHEIRVDAEVRWTKTLEDPDGNAVVGVGVQFKPLSKINEDRLNHCLFELSLQPADGE